RIFGYFKRLVGDNFKKKILKPCFDASLNVAHHISSYEVRKIASRDCANTDERHHQRSLLWTYIIGKCIVQNQAKKVAQKLRQREKGYEPQQIEYPGKVVAILDEGVVLARIFVRIVKLDAATLKFEK